MGAERGWEQEKEQLISTDLIEAHLNGYEIRAKQVLIKHADNISDAILAKQKVAYKDRYLNVLAANIYQHQWERKL